MSSRLVPLVVLLLAVVSATKAEPVRAPHTKPAEPPRTVELRETWRFGGADCETLLGTITEADADRDGNVYLLDTQLCHVHVISPTGELLRTIGGPGEGPGESQQPRDVVILPDDTVGLLELFPAELVRLTLDGEPRPTLTIGGADPVEGGFTSASNCSHRGGNFVVTGQRLGPVEGGQHRHMYLAGLDQHGKIVRTYSEATMTLDFGDLVFVEREMNPGCQLASALGPDGRVYVTAAWDRYAVEVHAPGGELERVVERAFANRPRTADELRRINALFDASARNIPFPVGREIEPGPAVIAGLSVDAAGRLWVCCTAAAPRIAPPASCSATTSSDRGGTSWRAWRWPAREIPSGTGWSSWTTDASC
ncbi:hypothetical protein KKG45_10220 [bacterium]|nr:hypothetical protein [bacterium]MBU1073611.1 hypothetical protein [bacterium]MBU1675951.1 hypothetical protein [bacterium]